MACCRRGSEKRCGGMPPCGAIRRGTNAPAAKGRCQRAADRWHVRAALGGRGERSGTGRSASAQRSEGFRGEQGGRNTAAAGHPERKCRHDRAAAHRRGGSKRSADENGRHRADDGRAHRQDRCGQSAARSQGAGQRERNLGRHDRTDVGRFRTPSGRGEAADRPWRRCEREIVLRAVGFGPRI